MFLCFQDQASALAKGVHALQHQLQQLHFNDQDADKELQPIQDDVQKTSQDLSKYVISKPAECVMHHMSSVVCRTNMTPTFSQTWRGTSDY